MIAILDIFNHDISLKLLFGPTVDYFVMKDEEITLPSRIKSYVKYNFSPNYNVVQIVPEKYPVLFIIGSLYDIMKKITEAERNKVMEILSKYGDSTVYWFDNHDYDYDPIQYFDSPSIYRFFKRNYSNNKTYSNKTVAYPFIMFGYESLIEKCEEIPKLKNLHTSKIDQVFFAGTAFQHNDTENNVFRNRYQILSQIHPYLKISTDGLMPYEEYLKNISSSKYAIDLLGVGEPNKRTFEIILSNTLMLSEYNDLYWPFEKELGERLFTEHTCFRNCEDFVRILQKLRENPALYDMCMKRQRFICEKFFTISWIRKYLMENLKVEHNLSLKWKVLLIDSNFHHKNVSAFMKYPHLDITRISKSEELKNLQNYDVVYSPGTVFDVAMYPDFQGKFIFGPHISVFPEERDMRRISCNKNKTVYIQPSQWAVDTWRNMRPDIFDTVIPLKVVPFAVDVEKFSPLISNPNKNKIMVYYKSRSPEILHNVIAYCQMNLAHYELRVFDYRARYDESNYLEWLQQSAFGIIIDAHESQGFAIEEALSCDVPLFVIGAKTMADEYGSSYPTIPCTTVPYWDRRCGELVYNYEEFEGINGIQEFLKNLQQNMYRPRQYILENLTREMCEQKFISAII